MHDTFSESNCGKELQSLVEAEYALSLGGMRAFTSTLCMRAFTRKHSGSWAFSVSKLYISQACDVISMVGGGAASFTQATQMNWSCRQLVLIQRVFCEQRAYV